MAQGEKEKGDEAFTAKDFKEAVEYYERCARDHGRAPTPRLPVPPVVLSRRRPISLGIKLRSMDGASLLQP